ncbi:hypothetical protein QTI05_22810 [Variovorax sp. J22R193]|uniref:hypothetical protein n=1 Tax=Variovorax fucosicus TaxID=3053517 RepID=UPI002574F004|nr:hypothetical protein [Variovorax sp. J22R193]MDM0041890.1 hypothetical protein [Variovorax sp. J22R193]
MQKTTSRLLVAWLLCYSALTYAASSLVDDVFQYDWASLVCALAAGLLGGAGRTILTLVSDKEFVGNIRLVLMKDLVVAMIGGGFAYIAIQGYNSFVGGLTIVSLPPIARDFRILVIVVAGASRGRWLGTVDRFATDVLSNARQKLRGGAPEDPPSVRAPLEIK